MQIQDWSIRRINVIWSEYRKVSLKEQNALKKQILPEGGTFIWQDFLRTHFNTNQTFPNFFGSTAFERKLHWLPRYIKTKTRLIQNFQSNFA